MLVPFENGTLEFQHDQPHCCGTVSCDHLKMKINLKNTCTWKKYRNEELHIDIYLVPCEVVNIYS